MSESNVPEIIKYLTEDNLKLMYSRLNRRYLVVDALPSVDSLEPADKNVIYVVKETVGETVRYWPNVLDNDVWKPFGIGHADLDGKADKVDAVEGHLVVADKDGNLVDADIMPGTFVALALDPSEPEQPHATDLRKIWSAYISGMPVTMLDNRVDGTGLYAHLNAAGYTWPDGNRMEERLVAVDEDNRPCDDTVPGYRVDEDGIVTFYEDVRHTVKIVPVDGTVYRDITVKNHDRVYLYHGSFTRVLRFVQFTCNELLDGDPTWSSRTGHRPVFYRMIEPYGSSTPNAFEVTYGESTEDIHDQMVTGARIGEGKLLPVDDGVIVLPNATAVNDGTLTITVGDRDPVVFSANDAADRIVDIPVATDLEYGLVRLTDDIGSDDPDAAITPAAVKAMLNKVGGYKIAPRAQDGTPDVPLAERSPKYIYLTEVPGTLGPDHYDEWIWNPGDPEAEQPAEGKWICIGTTSVDLTDYVRKVVNARAGNIGSLAADGSLADSGISDSSVSDAISKAHVHSNGRVLDDITAAYTTSEQIKLAGVEAGAQVNVIEGITVNGTATTPDANKNVNIAIDISNFVHKVANATGNIPKLDSNGDLVDSGVAATSLTSKAAADGGTDLSLVTTGEKYVWNDWASDDFPVIPVPVTVTIDGQQYDTVKIGSQRWMAMNLDYRFEAGGDPIPVGETVGTDTPAAWYYDNEKSTYGIDGEYNCGLLYNWAAVKYLDDNRATLLPAGWRVPSENDWRALFTEIGGSGLNGNKLKALDNSITSNWPSGWNGTDDYGFGAIPHGFYSDAFQSFGSEGDFWSITSAGVGYAMYAAFHRNYGAGLDYESADHGFAIRLVKDEL